MVGGVKFFRDLCKEDLVFPPWSDHPLACTLKVVRTTQDSESYEKEEHFPEEHAGRPAKKFLLGIFGFGRLLGSFCVNEPKTKTTPRKTVGFGENLKYANSV